MITCVIQYTLDPHAIEDFEKYATTWPPIIARCGGERYGYYLPKEGANDWAVALIDFESLPEMNRAYEQGLADTFGLDLTWERPPLGQDGPRLGVAGNEHGQPGPVLLVGSAHLR